MLFKTELYQSCVKCKDEQEAEIAVLIYQSYGFTWPSFNKSSKPKDGFNKRQNIVSVNKDGNIRFGKEITEYNDTFKLINYEDFINKY